jgi:hypothetical protein
MMRQFRCRCPICCLPVDECVCFGCLLNSLLYTCAFATSGRLSGGPLQNKNRRTEGHGEKETLDVDSTRALRRRLWGRWIRIARSAGGLSRISGRTARRQYSSRAYCSNRSNNGTDVIVMRVVEEQRREILTIFLQ